MTNKELAGELLKLATKLAGGTKVAASKTVLRQAAQEIVRKVIPLIIDSNTSWEAFTEILSAEAERVEKQDKDHEWYEWQKKWYVKTKGDEITIQGGRKGVNRTNRELNKLRSEYNIPEDYVFWLDNDYSYLVFGHKKRYYRWKYQPDETGSWKVVKDGERYKLEELAKWVAQINHPLAIPRS